MKKLLTFVLSCLLVVSFSIPAFAAGSDSGDAHVHSWSGWSVDRAATCTVAGSESRYCTVPGCGASETISIPATGHYWNAWYTTLPASVFTTGTQAHTCLICGASETAAIEKVLPFVQWAKKVTKLKVKKKVAFKVSLAAGDYVKKWKSSNKKIATVSKNGVVKAKKKGKVKITAYTASGKKITCKVKVVNAKKKAKKKSNSSSGGGTVYWTPYGSVYHCTEDCPTLSRSRTVYSGSVSQSGKSRPCKVCY